MLGQCMALVRHLAVSAASGCGEFNGVVHKSVTVKLYLLVAVVVDPKLVLFVCMRVRVSY